MSLIAQSCNKHVMMFKQWVEPTVFMNVSGPIMNAPFMCLGQNVLCCSLACNLLLFKVFYFTPLKFKKERKKKQGKKECSSIQFQTLLSLVRVSSGHLVPQIDLSLSLCPTKRLHGNTLTSHKCMKSCKTFCYLQYQCPVSASCPYDFSGACLMHSVCWICLLHNFVFSHWCVGKKKYYS